MDTSNLPSPTSVPFRGAAPTGLRHLMVQHPLIAFFVMAYAFSWIASIPFILSEWGILPGNWTMAFVVKPFVGPFLAGFVMTYLTEGKAGVARLRQSLWQYRENGIAYGVILLAVPAFFLLGIALMPGALASFTGLTTRFVVSYPITFVAIFFGGGPLGEEPGWRGFALPRMQAMFSGKSYTALRASLLLGVLWTFWHLPDFLTSAQHGGPAVGLRPFYANLPIFLLMVVAISIIFTWVYNNTHGSVFMATLLHASINTLGYAVPLFPVSIVTGSELAMLVGWGLLAAILLVRTRGQLGYPPEALA